MDKQNVRTDTAGHCEILTRATTRRNLEDLMLREINQTQKDKSYMLPLI